MADEIKNMLKELYEKLLDSRNGYEECAKLVKDPIIKQRAERLAREREQMMNELREKAAMLGYKAETSGSITAAVHRVFVDLKSLLTRGDKNAIIREIERGEGILIDTYYTALDKYSLPLDLRDLLRRQLDTIKQELTITHRYQSAA